MFGWRRRKRTRLLVNHACYKQLARDCDDNHPHDGWGHTLAGWATALEVEYPHSLCKEWALCLRKVLLEHGALEQAQEMSTDLSAPLHLPS